MQESMAEKINWFVSVDKLRVCLNISDERYDYLKNYHTRYDELNNYRILDEDDFYLIFIDEDEQGMTAVLNVHDFDGDFKLGTFTFNSTDKYKGKAFFSFENQALYKVFLRLGDGEPHNYICDLQYVCDYYGLTFNNITEIEIAFDSNYNYISKLRRMIKNTDRYDLYLNGKKVKNDETLDGYGEYYKRSRQKLSKLPTLYFSQAKDTDMKMRAYDKAKELKEHSPHKMERLKEWLGWENMDKLYRVEVVMHNTNVREFCERYGELLFYEYGEHANILSLLGRLDCRLAMFFDSTNRMIYFRDKTTNEKISLMNIAPGI